MPWDRNQMAVRTAQELKDGMYEFGGQREIGEIGTDKDRQCFPCRLSRIPRVSLEATSRIPAHPGRCYHHAPMRCRRPQPHAGPAWSHWE
jgi:hypothetical protein